MSIDRICRDPHTACPFRPRLGRATVRGRETPAQRRLPSARSTICQDSEGGRQRTYGLGGWNSNCSGAIATLT